MAEALPLVAGLLCCSCGMGWLALAMKPHWQQVRGSQPLSPRITRTLRSLGGSALLLALLFFLRADHATMASLVWVMALTASALGVAFTLAWRPRLLSWLLLGIGRDRAV